MTLVDWATVVGACAALGALAFFAWQIYLMIANERRRIQPLVIVDERRRRHQRGPSRSGWAANVRLRNEGVGPAFNIRFGIRIAGVSWAYRMKDEDPEGGNRQTALGAGRTLPEDPNKTFEIVIPSDGLYGAVWATIATDPNSTREDIDSASVYWARYENAVGQTWETLNPADRSKDLRIHRVRLAPLKERREQEEREHAREGAGTLDEKLRKELRSIIPQNAAGSSRGRRGGA